MAKWDKNFLAVNAVICATTCLGMHTAAGAAEFSAMPRIMLAQSGVNGVNDGSEAGNLTPPDEALPPGEAQKEGVPALQELVVLRSRQWKDQSTAWRPCNGAGTYQPGSVGKAISRGQVIRGASRRLTCEHPAIYGSPGSRRSGVA